MRLTNRAAIVTGGARGIGAGIALFLIIAAGLASRMEPMRSVPVLGDGFGDAAWAAAVYAVLRLLRPRASLPVTAITAALVGGMVECSQL